MMTHQNCTKKYPSPGPEIPAGSFSLDYSTVYGLHVDIHGYERFDLPSRIPKLAADKCVLPRRLPAVTKASIDPTYAIKGSTVRTHFKTHTVVE